MQKRSHALDINTQSPRRLANRNTEVIVAGKQNLRNTEALEFVELPINWPKMMYLLLNTNFVPSLRKQAWGSDIDKEGQQPRRFLSPLKLKVGLFVMLAFVLHNTSMVFRVKGFYHQVGLEQISNPRKLSSLSNHPVAI